jgi:hypothetical protein
MRWPPRLALLPAAVLAVIASAHGARAAERQPCADYEPLRRAFYGDLHVHTTYSLDASTQDTRNTPSDAYRFARGEALGIQPYDADDAALRTLQLGRPLDFAAVTDHSELFGEVATCRTPGMPGYDTLVCRIYRGWPRLAFYLMNSRASQGHRYSFCGDDGEVCREAARGPWKIMQDAAEAAYDRSSSCRFTSFVAYEWTGSGGTDASNLHRNVVFSSDAVPNLPISFVDGTDPAFLWGELDRQCRSAGIGCDVLVIPHNSNLSAEKMWPLENADGSLLTAEQARARASAEPLVEVFQHKGESECRLGAGTEDELCNFEQLPYDTMAGVQTEMLRETPGPNNFVRSILREGLAQQERIGVNPFALGMIASTDTHLGTPGYVDERRHVGHGGAGPPVTELPRGLPDRIEFNPGGLAAVWAEENSREAIFAALRRRETFGTSGPRMQVRLFGGWDYSDHLCEDSNLARAGYAGGVPMGGELPERPSGAAPTFIATALKDVGTATRPGTDLQRIQIVKLWLEDGEPRERVLDVAGNPAGGADVDLASCEPRGSGHAALCSVWTDPAFDPDASSLYYARVLENPTCRWSTWICNEHGVDCSSPGSVPDELAACCDPSIPKSIQERAWTSPIWYTSPSVSARRN